MLCFPWFRRTSIFKLPLPFSVSTVLDPDHAISPRSPAANYLIHWHPSCDIIPATDFAFPNMQPWSYCSRYRLVTAPRFDSELLPILAISGQVSVLQSNYEVDVTGHFDLCERPKLSIFARCRLFTACNSIPHSLIFIQCQCLYLFCALYFIHFLTCLQIILLITYAWANSLKERNWLVLSVCIQC